MDGNEGAVPLGSAYEQVVGALAACDVRPGLVLLQPEGVLWPGSGGSAALQPYPDVHGMCSALLARGVRVAPLLLGAAGGSRAAVQARLAAMGLDAMAQGVVEVPVGQQAGEDPAAAALGAALKAARQAHGVAASGTLLLSADPATCRAAASAHACVAQRVRGAAGLTAADVAAGLRAFACQAMDDRGF